MKDRKKRKGITPSSPQSFSLTFVPDFWRWSPASQIDSHLGKLHNPTSELKRNNLRQPWAWLAGVVLAISLRWGSNMQPLTMGGFYVSGWQQGKWNTKKLQRDCLFLGWLSWWSGAGVFFVTLFAFNLYKMLFLFCSGMEWKQPDFFG